MTVAESITQLTQEEAKRLLLATPDEPRLYWRSSYPNGGIGLCGRHALAWPRQLGALRLYVETELLQTFFEDVVLRIRRDRARTPYRCRVCWHLQTYRNIGDGYFGLDAYGPALTGHRADDERGLMADPDFGQPLVVDRVRFVRVAGRYSNAPRWFDAFQGRVFPALGASQYEREPLHGVYFVRAEGEVRELPVPFAEVVA